MSYIPQVDDIVTHAGWHDHGPVTVTATGNRHFLGTPQAYAGEFTYPHWPPSGPWTKIEPPVVYPERWLNVYLKAVGSGWSFRREADRQADFARQPRLGVIHLHPDGTLTMEQP